MPDDAYSINDLSRLTGLNVRTIRYYLSQGLIPASGESGPGAHYGQGHLDRLRLTKRLQAQYLPNAEIRRRLAALSDGEVARLVGEPEEDAPDTQAGSALDYIRSVLGSGRESRPPAASAQPAPAPPLAASVSGFESAPHPPTGTDPASMPPKAPTAARLRVLEAPAPTAAASLSDPSESSVQPERSQWERLQLAENIELHIRRPLSRIEQRRVERLITIARQVLNEDQS